MLENQLKTSAVDEETFKYARQEKAVANATPVYGTPHLLTLLNIFGAYPSWDRDNKDLVVAYMKELPEDQAEERIHTLIM